MLTLKNNNKFYLLKKKYEFKTIISIKFIKIILVNNNFF